MDVVLSFLVNGRMKIPKVLDTPGVSIAWLKCEIFCAVIAAMRFVGSVMDNICPVGFWLESMTGTLTLWSDQRISPLAYFISFQNVATAASAVSMLLRAVSIDVLKVMATWRARSVR